MTHTYISCADTAKLVRKALKAAFPGITFSVRSKSYSGGASISVGWTDGPTAKQVEAVTNAFEGATFDGQADLKEARKGTLDGQPVHFAADFIFTNRHHSVEFLRQQAEIVAKKYGIATPEVKDSEWGAWVESDGYVGSERVTDLVRQQTARTPAEGYAPKVSECAPAAEPAPVLVPPLGLFAHSIQALAA